MPDSSDDIESGAISYIEAVRSPPDVSLVTTKGWEKLGKVGKLGKLGLKISSPQKLKEAKDSFPQDIPGENILRPFFPNFPTFPNFSVRLFSLDNLT